MMKWIVLVIWSFAIFVFTCTESLREFMDTYKVSLIWDPNPKLKDFYSVLPFEPSPAFWIQKAGHIGAFFLLACILLMIFSSRSMAVTWALVYGCLTEILQLYFTRDGRLFDVGFDFIGVMAALIVMKIISWDDSNQIRMHKETH